MIVDRKWVKRNIGFDPIERPAPKNTFAVTAAAVKNPQPEDLQREIIDFDSESPAGLNFFAVTKATGLSAFTDIPWPAGLEPKPDSTARKGTGGRLPKADVLVVTWTVDEGHALSRVLTPKFDSKNDYVAYKRNFDQISAGMVPTSPARQAGRLGAYWTTKIGSKTAVVFKSESHMSQDTKNKPTPLDDKIPNLMLWKQIIEDVEPTLVITTGTGGGIGKQFEVGDVIVSPLVNFLCQKAFKRLDGVHGASVAPNTKNFKKAQTLFKANAHLLPTDNTRVPEITVTNADDLKSCIVTTDFFGFDTSDDHFGLQRHGDLSEMGDAIVGLIADEKAKAGESFPRWVAVRNVSDPQIKAEGTINDQANLAAHIYKAFGRWSSVCSGIVCWALIAAEK
jgi:hypothetical protein